MVEPKKVKIEAVVSLTEQILDSLVAYRNTRGFLSLDEAISAIVTDHLGTSSTPLWKDAEILNMPEAEKQIIKAVFQSGSMTPSEIVNKTGISDTSLRGHLAQVTRRYRRLKKEPLIKFNKATGKYEPDPRYREMILRLLE